MNSLRYTDDTTFMAESEDELKSFLMKGKEESEKVSVKLNIQGGGPKMVEEQDWETTFSLTNSSKEHFNAEQTPQNNF